ncbi:hypothetical protein IV37_GL000034 [Fructilactobacillus fructivorans]|uniref:hypothetical protein n=1 Tax=Fructilactobacillus fructivorans TaxID=1614 RepID=UPI0007054C22|nr:hypothetical protein [Fructilactobacillus fructivorans]KRN13322.1 hypothetical protein IV37_GL000034 [Fructilactobacillus fructivorans]
MELSKVIRLAHEENDGFYNDSYPDIWFKESEFGSFFVCSKSHVVNKALWNPKYSDFVSKDWELKKDSAPYDELSGKPKFKDLLG